MYRQFLYTTLLTYIVAVAAIIGVAVCVLGCTSFPYWMLMSSAALLLVYSLLSFWYYRKVLASDAQAVVRFYMLHTVLRFILCGAILLIASVMYDKPVRTSFMACFSVLFLLTMVSESFLFIHNEKVLNEKKKSI